MLQVKINKSKLISPEGDKLYIRDVTGNEGDISYVLNEDTGEYDEVINTTGYGVSNGPRDSVANFPICVLKKTTGDEFCEFDGYNPTSSMEFAARIPEDSRVFTYLVSISAVMDPNPEFYTHGEAVYDIATMTIKQVTNGEFIDVEAEDLIGTDYCTEPYDALFIAYNSLKKGAIMRKLMDALKSPKCKDDAKALRYDYDLISTILTGAAYEFWVGNKLLAQKDIEFLNSYTYST